MHKKQQVSLKECYEILNLSKDATLEEVKKAYRRRAFELHPDLNPNTPHAGYQFQRLNEAYVALSQILEAQEAEAKAHAQSKQEQETEQNNTQYHTTEDTASNKQHTQQKDQTADQYTTQENTAQENRQNARQQKAASAAYAKEDVLRDLLHDPFARRVFEDIYSEVHKQNQEAPPPSPPPPPPSTAKVDTKRFQDLHIANSISGKVKGWLRQQIDDEQRIIIQASSLFPGARLRLQIRRGLSEALSTIEIILPKDFIPGKPIRLRGLGKKVGKWQGDLYLTIQSKP